jgi:hypothetical protein
MLMKSSISFSKNTLFSQSVSSASISSVWRRINLAIGGARAANRFPPASFPRSPQSNSRTAFSAMGAAAPQQYAASVSFPRKFLRMQAALG